LVFNPFMPRLFLIALVLSLAVGCQSASKRPLLDVPVALTSEDLSTIDAALSASPSRLAVFPQELVASPLDPDRSGVIVDLDRQRAYVYSQSQLIAATRIASGKKYYRTPTGDFLIGQKNPNHASNLYGKLVHGETGEEQPGEIDTRKTEIPEGMVFYGAPMKHFMRFNTPAGKATAIGFHQGYVPGHPASHGCIRLPWRSAREFYKLLPRGMPVFVYGDKYGQPSRPLPELILSESKGKSKTGDAEERKRLNFSRSER
jgi:hypothetical protein